jgi:hypothetical protein
MYNLFPCSLKVVGTKCISCLFLCVFLITMNFCRWSSFPNLPVMLGVVVIILWLDLQLPMQSVPITNNVASSNPVQERCTLYNIM